MTENQAQAAKVITKRSLVINGILTVIWFGFWTWFLRDYVPLEAKPENDLLILAISAFTAASLTGVFWIAAGMYSVVWQDHKQRSRS